MCTGEESACLQLCHEGVVLDDRIDVPLALLQVKRLRCILRSYVEMPFFWTLFWMSVHLELDTWKLEDNVAGLWLGCESQPQRTRGSQHQSWSCRAMQQAAVKGFKALSKLHLQPSVIRLCV